jgi:ferredoxin
MSEPLPVEVDKESCLSSGRCVDSEPAAFRFDADELAEPTERVRELPAERLLAVIHGCPANAILPRSGGIAP